MVSHRDSKAYAQFEEQRATPQDKNHDDVVPKSKRAKQENTSS